MKSHGKKYIFSLLFLLSFLIYAVSPLSYPFAAKWSSRSARSADRAHHLHNLNILFWELICAKLDSKKDHPDADSTSRVLFRKARAILPQDANSRIFCLEDVVVSENHAVFLAASLSGSSIPLDELEQRQVYLSAHSGLSPPSV
jgi:hypothetical protein